MPRHRPLLSRRRLVASVRPVHLAAVGATLLELTIVLAMIGILLALAVPNGRRMLDRSRVTAATSEALTTFAVARHLAIRHSRRTTVLIDPGSAAMLVRIGGDTAHHRSLGSRFGVQLEATQDSMAFHPTGVGYGAANLSLRISRGRAADTVVVSRLGRVRH